MTTTNMRLSLPTPGVTPGLDWASQLNAALIAIDAHNHTENNGIVLTNAGIVIGSDYNFNQHSAYNVYSARFENLTTTPALPVDRCQIFVRDGELYYQDINQTTVLITKGGVVNASGTGGIGGDYSKPGVTATVNYLVSGGAYYFYSDAGITYADIRAKQLFTSAGITALASITAPLAVLSNLTLTNFSGVVKAGVDGVLSASLIVNADIHAAAAIDYAKLNLTSSLVNSDISFSAAIVDSKLATISTVGKVNNSATTATSANEVLAIVARDGDGGFAAGNITIGDDLRFGGAAVNKVIRVYGNDLAEVPLHISNNQVDTNVRITVNPYNTASSSTSTGTLVVYGGLGISGAVNVGGTVTTPNLTITGLSGIIKATDGVLSANSIVNTDIDAAAAIAYSKLNLTASLVNADINASAAIVYSKLNLVSSLVNADINASAAIAYAKLSLTSSLVNADISDSAAIAYSKLSLTNSIVNADINAAAAIDYAKLSLTASIVNADINAAAGIVDSKLATISTAGKVSNSATTATAVNEALSIVARDGAGSFSAGNISIGNDLRFDGTAVNKVIRVYGNGSAEMPIHISNNQVDTNVRITVNPYNTASSSTSTGTLVIYGGLGVSGAVNVGGTVTIANLSGIVKATAGALSAGTIVNEDIDAAAAIADSKLAKITTTGKVSNSATTATAANAASAIVARNATGDFAARRITLTSTNSACFEATTSSSGGTAITGTTSVNSTSGVRGNSSASTNAYGLYGVSSYDSGVRVDTAYGVYGEGISGYGVYGSSTYQDGVRGATVAASKAGVYGKHTTSAAGYGVLGETTKGAGVYGESAGTGSSDYGVYGKSGHTGAYSEGTSYGAYNISSSGTGTYSEGNTYGILSTTTAGVGVFGESSSGYGVRGSSSSSAGVYGSSSNSTGVYGTSTSGYAIYSGGSQFSTSGTAWSTSSDRRLKQDIATLEDGLGVILKIRPVVFRFKHKGSKAPLQPGFIAQEYEEVLPDQISRGPLPVAPGDAEKGNVDDTRYLAITEHLTPYLTAAIQEQQKMIIDLRQQIDNQAIDIALLKGEIDVIKQTKETI